MIGIHFTNKLLLGLVVRILWTGLSIALMHVVTTLRNRALRNRDGVEHSEKNGSRKLIAIADVQMFGSLLLVGDMLLIAGVLSLLSLFLKMSYAQWISIGTVVALIVVPIVLLVMVVRLSRSNARTDALLIRDDEIEQARKEAQDAGYL